MYTIKAKVEFSGVAWGLHFVNGVAETGNEYLAKKLEKKGYEVTEKEVIDPDIAEIERLKAYAAEHNIDIGNSSSVNGITKKITDAEKERAEAEKALAGVEGQEKPEAE